MSPEPKILIGTDPEFFITDGQRPISAIDFVGGTKDHPRQLGGRKGFFWLEDNVAVEFNIPPASNVEEFVNSIEWSMTEIKDRLADENKHPLIQPSVFFDEDELADPRTRVFGCSPDYNAWTGMMNERPMGNNNLRAAGGHIHVGYVENYPQADQCEIIQAMDLFLGVPSVLMDADTHRRQLYGKAGAFRPQPHGVEYRVLSNFWLRSKAHMKWAYEQTKRAFNCALNQPDLPKSLSVDIQHCINTSDFNVAQMLMEIYQLATV